MHIYQSIVEAQLQNKPCVLCTIVKTFGSCPQKAGAKMLVFADGTIKGTIGGGTVEYEIISKALKLLSNTNLTEYFIVNNEPNHTTIEVFIEKIIPLSKLYIFGNGHVGKSLAFFAKHFDFIVTVIDPRIQNEEIEETNIRFLNKEYIEAVDILDFDTNTYIVITTPSHTKDRDLIIKIATKPHAYIGLIGSQKKIENIRNYCLENKLLDDALLSSINMPIGINIKTISPNEIAISILAKMIDIKNKHTI